MRKIFIFSILSLSLFATSLTTLMNNAETLYTNNEIPASNFVKLKHYARLRIKPTIKSNTIEIVNSNSIYIMEYCKNKWCKLLNKNLYVYQTKLIKQ